MRRRRRPTLRAVRRCFAGTPAADAPVADPADVLRAQTDAFNLARGLIHGFYAWSFFIAASRLPDLVHQGTPPRSLLLWPVAWLGWTTHPAAWVIVLCGLFVAGTGLGAMFPGRRAARAVAALAWLEFVALDNSSVKIGHSLHLTVILAALLVALPAGWDRPAARGAPGDRLRRQRTLGIFWACQAALLLSYSLSGLGKLGGSLYQVLLGQASVFSPHALALHVADRLLQTASLSVGGAWLIQHPWTGWPAMVGTIYLQFFAFWVAFRPALGRWWAAGLIGFHLASFLTMTIIFPQNCFLLALLLFRSPFASTRPSSLVATLCTLPLFGPVLRSLRAMGRTHRENPVR